ncbi:MAG TPA: hypothetical protein VHC86_10755 [Opitutaceae bacterium]|nr:hypothetical protein [Opitutaceae bacterium]
MKKISNKAPAGEIVVIRVRLTAKEVAFRDEVFKRFSIPRAFFRKHIREQIHDELADGECWWTESFTYKDRASAAAVARRLFREDTLRRSVTLFFRTANGGSGSKFFENPRCAGMRTSEYLEWRGKQPVDRANPEAA